MLFWCERGEAVGDDDGEVAVCGVKLGEGVGMEGLAERWLAEVGGAIELTGLLLGYCL